jgi:hypothetical protein
MSTKVYGCSDDLIELEGDVTGEVGYITPDDAEEGDMGGGAGCLLVFDDGTMLAVKYGKAGEGIWAITTVRKGKLFVKVDVCDDSEADPYSDVAHFKDGLKKVWACPKWELVK